jgi:hypothetical protein
MWCIFSSEVPRGTAAVDQQRNEPAHSCRVALPNEVHQTGREDSCAFGAWDSFWGAGSGSSREDRRTRPARATGSLLRKPGRDICKLSPQLKFGLDALY